MAVVVATKTEKRTAGVNNTSVEQHWGVSATNTDITMASLTDTRPRRLKSVTVKYGGNASTTITVTHNYLGGPTGTTYDVLLNSQTLSAQTDYVFQPSGDWDLQGGDTITVLAPALAGQTARVVITTEVM